MPSTEVAVMVAVPALIAVILPFSTIAIVSSLEDHLICLLAASLGSTLAVIVSLCPTERARLGRLMITPVTEACPSLTQRTVYPFALGFEDTPVPVAWTKKNLDLAPSVVDVQ